MNMIRCTRMAWIATALLCGGLLAGCPCKNIVKVHNDTINPITAVYVKYEVVEDWGDNRINGDILPGETENIGNLLPGRYDVRLDYFAGDDGFLKLDVLCGEEYVLEASAD